MTNFEILQIGYQNGLITKNDVYDSVVNGKVSLEEYQQITNDFETELPLDILKQKKIQELDSACRNEIEYGFIFNHDGIDYLMGYDSDDQRNLHKQYTLLDKATEPIVWKVKHKLIFLSLTKLEFENMFIASGYHQLGKSNKYFDLCIQAQSCTSKEQLDTIVC
jgi:hypothetical protein